MMSGLHPRQITETEIKTFEDEGVVCLRGLFDPAQLEVLRMAAERSLDAPGQLHAELAAQRQDAGRFFHDTFVWLHDDTCRDFVFNSPAASIAQQLMRSEKVNIFFDQWLIKEPGTPTQTPWHHDMTYWPITGCQISTLWLALDPVSRETGAVEYVKGSHKWGQKFRPASFGNSNQYTEDIPKVPDIDALRSELEFVEFELQPGDCTVHQGLTVHGASGNVSSTQRRRAYITRWTGDDVVFHPRKGLQEMPDIPDGLNPGNPLDSPLWPRIIG